MPTKIKDVSKYCWPGRRKTESTVKEVGEFTITKTKHTKTGADMGSASKR